jgi:hypothetical protein
MQSDCLFQKSKFYFVSTEDIMDLSAPKQVTFWVAVILAVLGLLGALVKIPLVSTYAFWFLLVGFVVLALGSFMKNM